MDHSERNILIDQLLEYIQNPYINQAVLLHGAWGSVKTHFIKNEFGALEDIKVIYTSANGIASEQKIILQIYSTTILGKNKESKTGKVGSSLVMGAVRYGLDKIERNWQQYNQTTPEIIREFDSTVMKLAIKDTDRDTDTWGEKWGEKWGDRWAQLWPEIEAWWKQELNVNLNQSEIKILDMMAVVPDVSMLKLAETIGIVETAIGKNIKKLKDKGIIKRIGPAKGGNWKIIK